MPIVDAVRISMSLPVFFASVRNDRNDVLVDGGVLVNYPVKLFDREKYLDAESLSTHADRIKYTEQNAEFLETHPGRSPYVYNKETLGFRLDSKKEVATFRYNEPVVNKIDHFFEYAQALIKTILESQSNTHIQSEDWPRTIYIDTMGVSTTEFSLDDNKKKALEESGKNGATEYFKWYDDPANNPINRP